MASTREPEATTTESDLFVFAHIPKTAGMTFKRLLERQFPAKQMLKVGPDYQASVDHIKSLSAADKARIRCLSGHIPFGVHRYFPQKSPHYVSFVRDPVDRALSEYFFFANQPQLMPLIGLEVGAKLSPQAFWEHQASIGMMDFQTRVLSGYDDMVESVLPPYKKMPAEHADSLINDIVKSFTLIGTVERFDESLLFLKQIYGWRNVCYVRRNVASNRQGRSQLKESIAEEVRKLNPIDCRLYTHIKDMIDARIAENGERFDRDLRRFRFMNRWYTPAWNFCKTTGLRRLSRAVAKV